MKATHCWTFFGVTIFFLTPLFAQGPYSDRQMEAREAQKKEFLLTPIFQTTMQNNHPSVKGKEPGHPPLMSGTDEDKLKNAKLPSSFFLPPVKISPVKKHSVSAPPRVPNSIRATAVKEAAKDGDCGYDEVLKNYCFYPEADGEWKICSERWGTCLKRRQR